MKRRAGTTPLVAGLDRGVATWWERVQFAAGAFISSASWQSLIAVVGSAGAARLPSLRRATGVAGRAVVIAFALAIPSPRGRAAARGPGARRALALSRPGPHGVGSGSVAGAGMDTRGV